MWSPALRADASPGIDLEQIEKDIAKGREEAKLQLDDEDLIGLSLPQQIDLDIRNQRQLAKAAINVKPEFDPTA